MDKMHDLVIVLPGITGSVLQIDGQDLWNLSGQSLWGMIRDWRKHIEALRLPSHQPGKWAPGDGVRASRMINTFHGVFRLWKIDAVDRPRSGTIAYLPLLAGNTRLMP